MGLEFKRVLCPVDLSDHSLSALQLATDMARKEAAVLDVLHVIENPLAEIYAVALKRTGDSVLDAEGVQPLAKSTRMTEENAESLLKSLCQTFVAGLADVRYHIRRDDPYERIIEAAEDFRTDLIIMATHGRSGVKRLMLGSVTEKLVRHAACPVLTLNPEKTKLEPRIAEPDKGGSNE